MRIPFVTARRVIVASVATAALTVSAFVAPMSADAASKKCQSGSKDIYISNYDDNNFDGYTNVKPGTKLEYNFEVQNFAEYKCVETVVFHYSSKYLTITSTPGGGKILKGQGQVAWTKQSFPAAGGEDYSKYYRVTATVKKSAPKKKFTTYLTSTKSGNKIPGMTSMSKCTALVDHCVFDTDKVVK